MSINDRIAGVCSPHFHHIDWRYYVHRVLIFLGWTALITLIYAQSPLFTSNQNQYFLHGLAQGGFGYLSRDWLSNTIDPTPIFSKLVQISYVIFHWLPIYYIFYGLILGVYLFTLVGIAYRVFNLEEEKGKLTLFTAILLVNSAAIRFLFSRIFQPEWAFLLEGGLANQRVLGQVFQPSVFGVFLILSIYLFLSDKLLFSILAATLAVYFHPTYLLSYVILTLTYLLVTWIDKRNLRALIGYGLMACALVGPIVFQVYSVFSSGSTQTMQQAREILVNYRIPHHALISDWWDIISIIQIGLICVGIWLARRTKLFWVLLLGSVIAILISLTQILTENDALALLLPWRISVIFVPVSMTLIIGAVISKSLKRFPDFWMQHTNTIRKVNFLFIACLTVIGVIRFSLEYQEKINNNESGLYAFVRATKTADEVYLVPTKDQDFRLETGAPVYVDFKSIPYSADEVLEWYRREKTAESFYKNQQTSCSDLNQLVDQLEVTDVVYEMTHNQKICPGWTLVYQDPNYQVWHFKE